MNYMFYEKLANITRLDGHFKATATFGLFTQLGRYHDIIEYRDINLETISISDGFGFNQNIDISRYIAI